MLSFVFLFALAGTALAKLKPTLPIQATEWDARRAQTVQWEDDGTRPPLNLTGKVTISLWTGGVQQQSFLASLTENQFVNPTREKATVQLPRDAGPDGQYYFLRFDAPDSMRTSVFSGRFTLTHMTGSFNRTVLAQLGSMNGTSSTARPTSTTLSTGSALSVQSTTSSQSGASTLSLSSVLLATSLFALVFASR